MSRYVRSERSSTRSFGQYLTPYEFDAPGAIVPLGGPLVNVKRPVALSAADVNVIGAPVMFRTLIVPSTHLQPGTFSSARKGGLKSSCAKTPLPWIGMQYVP